MTIKQHILRDLCWGLPMVAFVYACELGRERWFPSLPLFGVAMASILIFNAFRKRAVSLG